MRVLFFGLLLSVNACVHGAHGSNWSLWAAETGRHPVENPVPPDAKSVAAGASLYETNCAECHGLHGQGDGPRAMSKHGPRAANLIMTARTQDDAYIFMQIVESRNGMPFWRAELSDVDVWNIVNFIRSLERSVSP